MISVGSPVGGYLIVANVRSLHRAAAGGPQSGTVESVLQESQCGARAATLRYSSCGPFAQCTMFVAQRYTATILLHGLDL